MQVNEAHDIDGRTPGTNQVPDSSTPQLTAQLRITLNELAKWRIDDSLIEFPKDTGEIDKGLSTISRAFLAATANMRSSSTEFGDGETGLEPCGENLLRKTVTVEKLKISEEEDQVATVQSALREAGILVALSHDNVTEIEGFVEDIANGRVWLIFPWHECGTLLDFVASQDWEVPERISLMYDVSQGVEYLHARSPPIFHCDLKPLNVLVTSQCRAVITGFNCAQRPTKTDLNGKTEKETWGRVIGYSIRWAAPEVVAENGFGLWSDIWSLGWVFHGVMTNSVPFRDEKEFEKIREISIGGYLPSVTDDPHISLVPGLDHLIANCWRMDPTKRPTGKDCREWMNQMPKIIPRPVRTSKSVTTTKGSPVQEAGKSPPSVKEQMGGPHEVQGYEGCPQSPIQQPDKAEPNHSPASPAPTLITPTNEDNSQDTVAAEAGPDESETILRSILNGLAHLSVAPHQLTIIDSTEVGCGRYGEVLLATLERPSQMPIRVAVKELRAVETRGIRKRIALRLARELQIWAKVKHPNILPLIGFHLSTNYEIARFISPLMTNGNVSQYLEKAQVGVLKRLDIVRDITAGMEHLHSCNPPICHADLKPTNILVNDTYQAVLCDFGLASFIQESGISSGLTTSRSVKGSLRYMSPELNLDDEAKHTLASDVWAWGCTAFEIMTDCVPYKRAAKDSTVLLAIAQKSPPGSVETFTSQLAGSISLDAHPALCSLRDYLPQCWDFDSQKRPQMSRILHDLFSNSILRTNASG